MITLTTPVSEAAIRGLKVGDEVTVTGTIYTGRDAVHKYLHEGGKLPTGVSFHGGILYHCGPVIIKDDQGQWKCVAAGPTTSIREEPYQWQVIRDFGLRGLIGKGGMGEKTLAACRDYGCAYLHAVGGAAQVLAETIHRVPNVFFMEQFGAPEAIWQFDVVQFPAIVTMDAHGNSLHKDVFAASQAELASTYTAMLDKNYAWMFATRMKAFLFSLAALNLLTFSVLGQTVSSATAENTTSNRPAFKELAKLPSFTNSFGIVLVQISDGFWATKYLVTQKEYQAVMGSNPSRFKADRNPVDSVSWNDAVAFCSKITQTETREESIPKDFVYTLPTQGQWEQLAAGTSLDQAVTSAKAPRTSTAPVGSLAPNGHGLYDLRGNVWQWCLDPQDKPFRVLRGGAWDTSLEMNLRPEFRWYAKPEDRKETFGFRCVLQRGG